MIMDINNINNCLSVDVHPLNLCSSATVKPHHNPKKKRTKFLKISTTEGAATSKPKPARKPDPAAPKITRPCTECGKKFWSWKALFGHMRCHPERQWRGINPPSNFRPPPEPAVDDSSIVTEEDHEVAACLLILASGPNKSPPSACTVDQGLPEYSNSGRNAEANVVDGAGSSSRFECSSCKKVFGSHQALGGHRASHKNVKGCYANAKKDGEDDGCCAVAESSLGHKCDVCLRVFATGQALGGHKRCHWEKMEEIAASAPRVGSRVCGLDLNLPAPPLLEDDDKDDDDDDSWSYSSRLLDLDLTLRL